MTTKEITVANNDLSAVIMHWHLWRARRRQRLMLEHGISLAPTNPTPIALDKTVIDPSQLEIFPARIVGEDDHYQNQFKKPAVQDEVTEEMRLSRRASLLSVRTTHSTRSALALENAEALATCSEGDLPLAAKVMMKQTATDEGKDARNADKPISATTNDTEGEAQAASPPGLNVLHTTDIAQSTADAMCVICLDDFDVGEKVRRLPCGHEFHCECIGK